MSHECVADASGAGALELTGTATDGFRGAVGCCS